MPAMQLAISAIMASGGGTLPPPPPVVSIPGPVKPPPARQFVRWIPGDVRCDGTSQPQALVLREPMGELANLANTRERTLQLTFTIDPTGRPVSIRQPPANPRYAPTVDLMPSLAASSFAANGMQQECTINYSMQAVRIDDVPVGELLRRDGYSAARSLHEGVYQRMGQSNCGNKPRPIMAVRVYPDFRVISGEAGSRGWLTLSYDIDPDGRPVNLQVVASSGNTQLEQQARDALSQSRYREGARSGCLASFGKGADILEAPALPARGIHGVDPDACDAKDRWKVAPRLDYPRGYRSRQIDGWAIVRYDVAPWGQIGNVEVLEAQPTAEFGDLASAMISRASYQPIANGLTGCIDRIRFRMKRDEDAQVPLDESSDS